MHRGDDLTEDAINLAGESPDQMLPSESEFRERYRRYWDAYWNGKRGDEGKETRFLVISFFGGLIYLIIVGRCFPKQASPPVWQYAVIGLGFAVMYAPIVNMIIQGVRRRRRADKKIPMKCLSCGANLCWHGPLSLALAAGRCCRCGRRIYRDDAPATPQQNALLPSLQRVLDDAGYTLKNAGSILLPGSSFPDHGSLVAHFSTFLRAFICFGRIGTARRTATK